MHYYTKDVSLLTRGHFYHFPLDQGNFKLSP